MRSNNARATLAIAALALSALPALAQTPEENKEDVAKLQQSAAQEQAEQTIRRIEDTLKQRPNDGMLQYFMAMFQAQAGHREKSLELLKRVADRKMGFHPTVNGGFDDLWKDAEFQQVLADIKAGEARVDGAKQTFVLPDPGFVPEGIAYDRKGKRYFLGSITQRRIIERTSAGKFIDFSKPEDGLYAVLGLRVDEPRGLLYAVTNNAFTLRKDEARDNSLVVYDLKTRALKGRWRAPEAVNLNDVAVSATGEVAVTDSATGTVYRLDRNSGPDQMGGELIFVIEPRSLPGANGIVFSADGKRLYVAISTGIAVVDLATGEATRLPQPDEVATGGVDCLYLDGADLIGVQNFICPGRVVRILLNAAGDRIDGMQVLQTHHAGLDEPTTGAIVGKTLQVIANSSVALVQPDGSLPANAQLQPAAILAVPLNRN